MSVGEAASKKSVNERHVSRRRVSRTSQLFVTDAEDTEIGRKRERERRMSFNDIGCQVNEM